MNNKIRKAIAKNRAEAPNLIASQHVKLIRVSAICRRINAQTNVSESLAVFFVSAKMFVLQDGYKAFDTNYNVDCNLPYERPRLVSSKFSLYSGQIVDALQLILVSILKSNNLTIEKTF